MFGAELLADEVTGKGGTGRFLESHKPLLGVDVEVNMNVQRG
jgi:hypothetical protein